MNRYIEFESALALLVFSLCSWTAAAQEDRAELIEKIRPAVVAVTVYNDKDEVVDQVSGFFINEVGHLLTCRHVLRGASRVEAQTREGKVCAVSMVIAEDPDLDLIQLLIDLPEGKVPYLRMTDVGATRGEQVTVFGYQHIVQGMVSCARKLEESGQNFQLSADSAARATGGPVVNKNGDVIGIATGQEVEDQTPTLAMVSRRPLALFQAPATLSDWNARIRGDSPAGRKRYFLPK